MFTVRTPAKPSFVFWRLDRLVLERVWHPSTPHCWPIAPVPHSAPPTPAPTHPLRASFGYDVSYVGGSYLHYKCSVC